MKETNADEDDGMGGCVSAVGGKTNGKQARTYRREVHDGRRALPERHEVQCGKQRTQENVQREEARGVAREREKGGRAERRGRGDGDRSERSLNDSTARSRSPDGVPFASPPSGQVCLGMPGVCGRRAVEEGKIHLEAAPIRAVRCGRRRRTSMPAETRGVGQRRGGRC